MSNPYLLVICQTTARKIEVHLSRFHRYSFDNAGKLRSKSLPTFIYKPTSDNFWPSVERGNRVFNQMHFEETVIMDTVPRHQSHFSSNSSYYYQGSSTSVATSNRQSPQLFGTNLSPTAQTFSFKMTPHFNPMDIKRLTPTKEVTMGQTDFSGRPTVVILADASTIPLLENLKRFLSSP